MAEGQTLHEALKCLGKKLTALSQCVISKFKFQNHVNLFKFLVVRFVVVEHGKVSPRPVEEPGGGDVLVWLLGCLPTALGAQVGEAHAGQVSWT